MKVLKWEIDWHAMYNHLHNGGVEVEGDCSWDNVEVLTHFGIALSGVDEPRDTWVDRTAVNPRTLFRESLSSMGVEVSSVPSRLTIRRRGRRGGVVFGGCCRLGGETFGAAGAEIPARFLRN